MPANTYTGQTADVQTAAVLNYLVTRSTLADDAVYNMTKSMYESLPELQSAHSAGKGSRSNPRSKDCRSRCTLGAERYY